LGKDLGRIWAIIKPYHYGGEHTGATIQDYAQYW
jgi:hypothetical protein